MRDKLIELLEKKYNHFCDQCGVNKQTSYIENLADYLITHGVTIADVPGNNAGDKWIPVSERKPKPYVSVLAYMPGEQPLPTVREGYIAGDGLWYAGYFTREPGEVTHWMPMPAPLKEDKT